MVTMFKRPGGGLQGVITMRPKKTVKQEDDCKTQIMILNSNEHEINK